jgi:hypothetical protein
MTTQNITAARRPQPIVGQRVEIARYAITGATRVIYGQRIDTVVRLTDCPESGEGRAYLIERELEQDGYTALKALVDDYVTHAGTHDRIPMATGATLGALADRQPRRDHDPGGRHGGRG